MTLRLSNFIVTATLATLFVGCGQSDPNPVGAAGSGGRASAGASATAGAGAGTAGSGLGGTGGPGGSGGSTAGGGAGGSGGSTTGGGGSAGSTAGAAGSSTYPPTFATVKLVLDSGGCDAAPCHAKGGTEPPGMPLALPRNDDTVLYTQLTTYTSKGCGNIPLVKKGDGEGSALVKILRGQCATPTMRMPLDCDPDPTTGNCIDAEYIALISQWITNGAAQQ